MKENEKRERGASEEGREAMKVVDKLISMLCSCLFRLFLVLSKGMWEGCHS